MPQIITCVEGLVIISGSTDIPRENLHKRSTGVNLYTHQRITTCQRYSFVFVLISAFGAFCGHGACRQLWLRSKKGAIAVIGIILCCLRIE